MISKITKRQILDNRFAFTDGEDVLVNALDLCNELIENEHLKRKITRLQYENDLLRTRIALRSYDCVEYRKIDIKG